MENEETIRNIHTRGCLHDCQGPGLWTSRFEQAADHRDHAGPLPGFGVEVLLSGASDLVELRAAIVLARAPTARDEALLLEAEQRRIDGALIQRQHAAGHLLDAARDAVAVLRAQGLQGLQNHQIERAVLNVCRCRHALLLLKGYMSMAEVMLKVNMTTAPPERFRLPVGSGSAAPEIVADRERHVPFAARG